MKYNDSESILWLLWTEEIALVSYHSDVSAFIFVRTAF